MFGAELGWGENVTDWVPVALSNGLNSGGVMRAVIDATDVVVWRTSSGHVNAWNNRCPHRGMRLSFGFVRGDQLACLYHGWQYGEDSVCRYIPAHPDLEPPKTIAATVYGVAERNGLIWVSLDDDKPLNLPDEQSTPVRSIAIDADADAVRTALNGAAFPISDDWQPGSGTFSTGTIGDEMIVVEGRAEGQSRKLFAALQPLPEGGTMLHLLVDGDPDVKLKKQLSKWAERLRWFLENPDTPTLSWTPARTDTKAA